MPRITPREIAPVSKLIFYSSIMIIWSLSGLRISLYPNKYFVLHRVLLWGISVLVEGTSISIGDVPIESQHCEVAEGRAVYRSSRASCVSPITFHIF